MMVCAWPGAASLRAPMAALERRFSALREIPLIIDATQGG